MVTKIESKDYVFEVFTHGGDIMEFTTNALNQHEAWQNAAERHGRTAQTIRLISGEQEE